LGQLSLADGPVDPNHQSSFDQMFAGIGQSEVGEYVARAGLLLKGLAGLGVAIDPGHGLLHHRAAKTMQRLGLNTPFAQLRSVQRIADAVLNASRE
jgi:hypothetical protein